MSYIFNICPKISNIKNVKHGFFGKKGGVSLGDYDSLNCGYSSDDLRDNVSTNRKISVDSLKLSQKKKLCSISQIHSNIAVIVDDKFLSSSKLIEADAMVTSRNDVILSILTADCVPVIFVAPESNIIAVAHAGWKGAYSGILQNTVTKMVSLGCKPKEIISCIGPCIAQSSYEVDELFYQKFVKQNKSNHNLFIDSKKNNHFMFDLPS